ncbi:S26 family signal peptidase [Candidatus Daviesbacteria bacterium]|nr:S26 family signal peptidase [Candidatus Daviesbacteria bacterium]
MFPTLRSGQDVLCFNWAYIFSKPKKGDMVIVQSAKFKVQSEIVKRIQKVEGNKVYLIGDNARYSTDSRNFGLIDQSEIIGKVIFVR